MNDIDTPAATAAYLGDIPEATLTAWRYRGIGPKYSKVGRHIRYRKVDVDRWLETRSVSPHGGNAA